VVTTGVGHAAAIATGAVLVARVGIGSAAVDSETATTGPAAGAVAVVGVEHAIEGMFSAMIGPWLSTRF
jgi:hypothetical protein